MMEECFDCKNFAERQPWKRSRLRKRASFLCRIDGEKILPGDVCLLFDEGIQKSPLTQGGGSGQGNTGQEQNTLHGSDAQAERKGLLFLPDSVKLDSPNNHDSHIWRLARAPYGAKDQTATASNALDGLAYIGGVQRPGTCEGPAAYREPGSVDPAISFLTPKSRGCNHD